MFKIKPYMCIGVNEGAEAWRAVKTENRLLCIIYFKPYKDYFHLTDQKPEVQRDSVKP